MRRLRKLIQKQNTMGYGLGPPKWRMGKWIDRGHGCKQLTVTPLSPKSKLKINAR